MKICSLTYWSICHVVSTCEYQISCPWGSSQSLIKWTLSIFIRPQKFGVVLCYGHVGVGVGVCVVVRRQFGFRSITLVLLFGTISNFNTMILYIKYRLGLILGDVALTVFKEGPKGDFSIFKCKFFIFCPILMGFFSLYSPWKIHHNRP